jgi:hypothetical protein
VQREYFDANATRGRSFTGRGLVLLMEEFVIDVGPEFLEGEGYAVQANIEDPALTGFGPGALAGGVVEIGDAGSRSGSYDFRSVE